MLVGPSPLGCGDPVELGVSRAGSGVLRSCEVSDSRTVLRGVDSRTYKLKVPQSNVRGRVEFASYGTLHRQGGGKFG